MFSPNLILHSSTRCRLERMSMATHRRRIIMLTRNWPWSDGLRRVRVRGEAQLVGALLELPRKAQLCTSLCLQIGGVHFPNGRLDQWKMVAVVAVGRGCGGRDRQRQRRRRRRMVDGGGRGGQRSTSVAVAADYGEDRGPQWAAAAAAGSRWPAAGDDIDGGGAMQKWLFASFVFILLYLGKRS
jgi:hypothetical protein